LNEIWHELSAPADEWKLIGIHKKNAAKGAKTIPGRYHSADSFDVTTLYNEVAFDTTLDHTSDIVTGCETIKGSKSPATVVSFS
jgi:hypothetical protein